MAIEMRGWGGDDRFQGNRHDRWQGAQKSFVKPSMFPEFTDVKILIDMVLVEYQAGREMMLEIKRQPMICAPFRDDMLLSEYSTLNELRSNPCGSMF